MNQVITIRHISEVENSYACMYFHVCFMNHVYLTTYDKIEYILKNPNLIIQCYGTLFLLQALCFHLKNSNLILYTLEINIYIRIYIRVTKCLHGVERKINNGYTNI